jgi:hypothetical protein
MNSPRESCALCGHSICGSEPAHAVQDKVICDACRRAVAGLGPRPVLPYAGPGARRRRWAWPAIAVAAGVVVLGALLLLGARRVAVERARAEAMRALAARQQATTAAVQARLASEVEIAARPAETRPAE